jgi:hypothetical protein
MSADRLLSKANTAAAVVTAGGLALTGGLIGLVARHGAPTTHATNSGQQQTQQPIQQQPLQQSGDDDGGGFVQPVGPSTQAPLGGSHGS